MHECPWYPPESEAAQDYHVRRELMLCHHRRAVVPTCPGQAAASTSLAGEGSTKGRDGGKWAGCHSPGLGLWLCCQSWFAPPMRSAELPQRLPGHHSPAYTHDPLSPKLAGTHNFTSTKPDLRWFAIHRPPSPPAPRLFPSPPGAPVGTAGQCHHCGGRRRHGPPAGGVGHGAAAATQAYGRPRSSHPGLRCPAAL